MPATRAATDAAPDAPDSVAEKPLERPVERPVERPGASRLTGPLVDSLQLSALPMMACDPAGRVLLANEAMRTLMGDPLEPLPMWPAEVAALCGWPAAMPPIGQTRRSEGWVQDSREQQRHWRVSVRGVAGAPVRWLLQIEDCQLEDRQALAQIEIAALMGTAGLGVATFDPARGWTTSASARPPQAATGRAGGGSGGSGGSGGTAGAAGAAGAAGQASRTAAMHGQMSVGRDLVEPESMVEYERLQTALRQRQRIEARYAVRHPDMGRRWLLTRVEPADLGTGEGGFSVVTLDVTEEETARRHNEQLLHELGTILDVSPAGIAYLRGNVLVRCNARFEALLGLAAGAGAGMSVEALMTRCGVNEQAALTALTALREQGSFETEFQCGRAEHAGQWHSLALRRAVAAGGQRQEEIVAVLSDVTRLRAQQAELEGLERERELMFSLSDVGIIYQRDGHIERANQAMADLIGRPLPQLHGLPLSELYEDDRVYWHHVAQERRDLAQHGRARGERRIRRGDGTPVWVQVSQRPVDVANLAAGTISSFVSVDERRRARESLLAQAERTRAILDSVLVGIDTVGDRGIEWMNRSARRMFGGELADFIEQPISEVASSDLDHPLRRTDWLATLSEGQAETFECRLVARDGRTFWVVGNVVATGREAGSSQLNFALLDIERRREAENQIAQARASLQRIIETAPLAIALFDADNQEVLQLNQMMAAFARRPASEIRARQPALWLPGPEAAALSVDLHRAVGSTETLRRELYRPADPETGEPARVWDMRIVSLVDAGDAGAQLLLVASDVTEQRAADEARLEAAIAQREMLVKEVHHRIKNNLQGVAGLLQQNAQRNPEASSAIAEAVGHVHAIAQVHGLQVGMTGPLRVRGVMEAIAVSVQRMFGRAITVEVQGPAAHRFALTEADSIPVALTVNELLTNAIKHSQGGAIICRMVCGEAEVGLWVINTGQLGPDFSLAQVPSGISGLGLVRALLPRKGAAISLDQEGDSVIARLKLAPPAVTLLEPL
ncbi:PAS domain S-box protein [Ideonella sp.]|uniref:PAS domain-containing sensor histidine kinase n=1 Tax=Ideonella sp. TaxID=1929293 RepID=UPI003BB68F22